MSAFQQHQFVVSAEPVESAVERQGMGLAVEAQPAQEQHHSRAGGEPQLLSGMQPLLLAIGKSPASGRARDQCPGGSAAAGDLWGWKGLLEAPFQAFVHAGHRCLHYMEGRSGGADEGVPGF